MARGALYQKMIGGATLNIADLLLDNFGNMNKTTERIIVEVDNTNGLAANITLPEITNLGPATNFELIVTDKIGGAGAANITITRGGLTDKVNGGTNVVINQNYGKAHLMVASCGTGAAWAAIVTGTTSTPPKQQNDVGVTAAGNTYVLSQTPRTDQHIIVAYGAGAVLRAVTDYTINVGTKTITVILGGAAPGDPINVFYSY